MDFAKRVVGAMRMHAATYEAIEADPAALGQATVVVLGFGVGAGVALAGAEPRLDALLAGTAWAVAGWLSWAIVVYHVGVRVLAEPQTRADPAEVARTIGFSAAPGLLLPLAVLPPFPTATTGVILLWMLASMVVAVRQALDFTHLWRAVLVCVLGWSLVAAIMVAMAVTWGPFGY